MSGNRAERAKAQGHGRDDVPQSHDQITHDAETHEEFEFDPAMLDDLGPIPNIPARDGYVQRWVRNRLKNEEDGRNLYARSMRGWTPRDPASLPNALRFMGSAHNGQGVIATKDLILMERPQAIHDKVVAHNRKRVKELELGVKHALFRETKGFTNAGFTAPEYETKASVKRGVRIQED